MLLVDLSVISLETSSHVQGPGVFFYPHRFCLLHELSLCLQRQEPTCKREGTTCKREGIQNDLFAQVHKWFALESVVFYKSSASFQAFTRSVTFSASISVLKGSSAFPMQWPMTVENTSGNADRRLVTIKKWGQHSLPRGWLLPEVWGRTRNPETWNMRTHMSPWNTCCFHLAFIFNFVNATKKYSRVRTQSSGDAANACWRLALLAPLAFS